MQSSYLHGIDSCIRDGKGGECLKPVHFHNILYRTSLTFDTILFDMFCSTLNDFGKY